MSKLLEVAAHHLIFRNSTPPSPEEITRITGSIDGLSEIAAAIGGGSTDTAKCCIASKYFGIFKQIYSLLPSTQLVTKPYFIALPAPLERRDGRYYVTYRESDMKKFMGKVGFGR